MRRLLRSLLPAGIILGAGALGCADSKPPVEAADRQLAALEGEWLCDVQRFAFADTAERDARLESRLTAAGTTRAEYDAFIDDLPASAERRALVREAFATACPASSEGVPGEPVE